MGILVTLMRLGALVTSFIVPSIEAALTIKSLFSLDPDFQVNLVNLTTGAIVADDKVIDMVNTWRMAHGMESLPEAHATIPPLASGMAVAMPILVFPPSQGVTEIPGKLPS